MPETDATTQAATSTATNGEKEQQQQAITAAKPETKTLTQVEIDAIVEDRLARDRKTREEKLATDLGMSLKEAKALIVAQKKAKEDEKTALELANEKSANLEKSLKDRDLRDFKRTTIDQMIADKKIKLPDGVSISDVLDMVNGPDEDGILKSAGKLPKFFPFNASMGTSTNPANTAAKPANIDEQIKAAEKTGNWNLATSLKMAKQREMFK
jgi:DNA-binding transcriptional MerR regulator